MQYELVKLTINDEHAVKGMLAEWKDVSDTILTRLFEHDVEDFKGYVDFINTKVEDESGAYEIFFAKSRNTNAMLGAVKIYTSRNAGPVKNSQIEFCVRPTHRSHGFGDVLLRTVLQYCNSIGLLTPTIFIPSTSHHLFEMFMPYLIDAYECDGSRRLILDASAR